MNTAGGDMEIKRQENVTITLSNNFKTKFNCVLFVPGIGVNLLSTVAMRKQRIEMIFEIKNVKFQQNSETIATDKYKDQAVYLD